MKILILFFTLTFCAVSYSQSNSDVIRYSANTLEAMLYNSANELVNEKVWGKNVTVYYDKVFKSYKMEFENEDGKIVFYKFTLIRDLGNDMKLMQTPEGLTVTIIDKLANGGLFIKNEKFDDGTTLYYATSKATKLN